MRDPGEFQHQFPSTIIIREDRRSKSQMPNNPGKKLGAECVTPLMKTIDVDSSFM